MYANVLVALDLTESAAHQVLEKARSLLDDGGRPHGGGGAALGAGDCTLDLVSVPGTGRSSGAELSRLPLALGIPLR